MFNSVFFFFFGQLIKYYKIMNALWFGRNHFNIVALTFCSPSFHPFCRIKVVAKVVNTIDALWREKRNEKKTDKTISQSLIVLSSFVVHTSVTLFFLLRLILSLFHLHKWIYSRVSKCLLFAPLIFFAHSIWKKMGTMCQQQCSTVQI